MNDTLSEGRQTILAVIVSSIIFLILHSTELPGQEYGNRLLLTLFRVSVFAPLLICLFMGMNWARITLAILCSVLVLGGAIGFLVIGAPWATPMNITFLAVMMACVIFNTIALFFSSSLRNYMRIKRERRSSYTV